MSVNIDDLPFDEKGNLPRGDNGEIAPPVVATETTDATQPSPAPVPPVEPAEKISGEAEKTEAGTTPPADQTKEPPVDDGKLETAEEAELREKFSKPTDKGDEWQIRAFRHGEKLKKQHAPIQDILDQIGSPDRARRGLEMTAALADPEVPIADAVSKMTALSSSRLKELNDHLYNEILDNHPNVVVRDLIGEEATVEELQEGLKLLRSGAKGQERIPPQSPTVNTTEIQKPTDLNDEEWATFQDQYPEVVNAMKAQQAELAHTKAEMASQVDERIAPLSEKLKSFENERQQKIVEAKVAEIAAEGEKIYQEAYSPVEEGLRELGLEPDPAKDDERTIKLKTRTMKNIRAAVEPEFEGPDGPGGPEDLALCTDEQKANRKLIKQTMDLLTNGDFVAARDYLDSIKAQVDLAFQRVADPEIEVYNADMLQSTATTRTGDNGHRRPEIVGGTAAGGVTTSKTPWLEPGYKQPGESGFEAMHRYFEEKGVPARV